MMLTHAPCYDSFLNAMQGRRFICDMSLSDSCMEFGPKG